LIDLVAARSSSRKIEEKEKKTWSLEV